MAIARRGDALREHILDSAKRQFLETGFDRTSMDAIAARAETSKRSLYAHFPTKDALLIAVVDRTRALFAGRMHSPAAHGSEPVDAVARYCGRFLQLLSWSSVALMLRLGIAEADRLPALASGLYDALFGVTVAELSAYVSERWQLESPDAEARSLALLGAVVHPTLPRLLFGLDPLDDELPEESRLERDVDLARIAALTATLLGTQTPAPDHR